jgi:hypothetical protein
MSSREVFFDSAGVRCAADLYLPEEACGPVPCVVMGHGGSGTKRLGLPSYAEKFARGGVAAFVFDYRGFGASGGQPRQVIDVAAQREDYRAAIDHVRGLPEIDPRRVAVWGTSLSGGHVLAVAAADPGIAAVVSQVPMIDGMHRGRTLRQRLNREVATRTWQFVLAAVRDVLDAARGKPPRTVPVVAPPGQVAVFTEPEARETFEALGGEATGWRNELAPRFLFALPQYVRGTAERLSMPLLMCVADHDLQASSAFAARVAARAPHADLRLYPLGHFDVYTGEAFDQISDAQLAFLQTHLFSPNRRELPSRATRHDVSPVKRVLSRRQVGRALRFARPVLVDELGERAADEVAHRMAREYREVAAVVPALRAPTSRMTLRLAVDSLVLYRSLPQDTTPHVKRALVSRFVARWMDGQFDTPIARWVYGHRAPHLLLRRFWFATANLADEPDGWRFRFLKPRPGLFYGVDVTRCGIVRFLADQGAAELAPLMCQGDYQIIRFLPPGVRFVRTQVIAEDAPYCDFRYATR